MPIFPYYNPYNRRPFFYNNFRPNYAYKSNIPQNFAPNYNCNNTTATSDVLTDKSSNKTNDTVWLDLFGIKLYFDDVLILSLLFFLYKEEVKDEGLFLALVLLLIS